MAAHDLELFFSDASSLLMDIKNRENHDISLLKERLEVMIASLGYLQEELLSAVTVVSTTADSATTNITAENVCTIPTDSIISFRNS